MGDTQEHVQRAMGDFEFVVNEGPEKGTTIPFPGPNFYVGGGADCHVRLDPALVQPRHAEVRFDSNGVPWIRDLTGQHLLWLNGNPIEKAALASGSLIRLGQIEVIVRRRTSSSGVVRQPTPLRNVVPSPLHSRRISSSQMPVIRAPTPRGAMALGEGFEDTLQHGVVNPLDVINPGEIIDGRYEITAKIAIGGMGEVYLAQHTELGKQMALKVMLPELSNDPEFVARFKREAIAASRIGQQNIVDISDFGRTPNGRFYFVMEYLDGVTLASLLHRDGALPLERALNISVQVARALAAAHAQGIVHRDLKPENVMVIHRPGQPDFVKVLDFGVAKVSAGPGHGGHTAVGLVVGTPQYMSPEQAKAIPVDTRSDIYSLGLIIYELLSGKPTFTAETPSMLMVKHVTEAPPPLPPGPSGEQPDELIELVTAMLEKDPEKRPQQMDQVVERLEELWARVRSQDPSLRRSSATFSTVATPQVPQSGVALLVRATGTSPAVDGAVLPVELDPVPTFDAAPAPAPARRSKLPMVIGGLIAVLALSAAWFALNPGNEKTELAPKVTTPPGVTPPVVKAPEPEPLPPEVIAPAKVTMTFTGPESTEVFEGDVMIGATPLVLTRDPGSVAELSFRAKGFEPMTRKVKFESEQTIGIELEREKKVVPVKKKPTEAKPTEDLKDLPF